VRFTILGASGFIGRRLVNALKARGDEVFAPARGDLSIFQRNLGHVIYAIGVTADFRSRPYDTVRAHVSQLADVLEKGEFDSLLYLSSTRLYSGAVVGKEDTPIAVVPENPSDLYNISKLMGESLCLSCGRPAVKVARLANVVGSGNTASENFIDAIVREAVSGKITLRSHPQSRKDYICIEDVIDLLMALSTRGSQRIYNIASGIQLTHAQLTSKLAELTGCKIEVDPGASILSYPPVDITRIRQEFNYVPRSVIDALPRLIQECPRG